MKRVNAVCTRTEAQSLALLRTGTRLKGTQKASREQITDELRRKIVGLREAELGALEALEPPSGLRASFAELKRLLGEQMTPDFSSTPMTPARHAHLVAVGRRRELLQSKLGIGQCI